jgi:serine/threonine protein kinase
MTPEPDEIRETRRRDIERICQAALDRDPLSRAAFLAEACGGDDALRREVESLLAQESSVERFMEGAVLEVTAAGALAERGFAIGQSIGPYHVLSSLGAGEMGEVFRARDTRLDRDVALKVLPGLFALDPSWLARFHREAKVLASLSNWSKGRRLQTGSQRGRFRSTKRCRSPGSLPTRWKRRTTMALSTAI